MNSTDFKAIEKFDVIEFKRESDLKPRTAGVDKDGDNAVLVGYVYNNKGYWHTVTAKDVVRVVKSYNAPVSEGDKGEAIKKKINGAIELLKDASDLA